MTQQEVIDCYFYNLDEENKQEIEIINAFLRETGGDPLLVDSEENIFNSLTDARKAFKI